MSLDKNQWSKDYLSDFVRLGRQYAIQFLAQTVVFMSYKKRSAEVLLVLVHVLAIDIHRLFLIMGLGMEIDAGRVVAHTVLEQATKILVNRVVVIKQADEELPVLVTSQLLVKASHPVKIFSANDAGTIYTIGYK